MKGSDILIIFVILLLFRKREQPPLISGGTLSADAIFRRDTKERLELLEGHYSNLATAVGNNKIAVVNTFEQMLGMLKPSIPRFFTVKNDEEQEDTDVNYWWNGEKLFEYGSVSLCDTQPYFN